MNREALTEVQQADGRKQVYGNPIEKLGRHGRQRSGAILMPGWGAAYREKKLALIGFGKSGVEGGRSIRTRYNTNLADGAGFALSGEAETLQEG